MNTVIVWVLVYATHVHGGAAGGVSEHKFKTVQDCERVAQAFVKVSDASGYKYNYAQCVQVEVVAGSNK
jgi:hypothetical protein